MLRVSPDGSLGPWAKVKVPSKIEAPSKSKVERVPVVASAREARVRGKPVETSVGASLLAAVLATPDDDAPRLVYADWLIEQGDPRGEFIQIQCRLGRVLRGVKGFGLATERPEDFALAEREQAIFKAHVQTWIAPIRTYLRRFTWERGFVAEVTSGPPFLVGAPLVLSSHPVTRLVLEGMKSADLAQFAKASFPHLRRLSLASQKITAKTTRHLLGENLAKIEWLDLTANDLGDAGTTLLATESGLRDLKSLGLAACAIGATGMNALANSSVFANLESVALWGNPIPRAGFEAIIESRHLRRLKTLHLRGMKIDAATHAKLCDRFEVVT
jgi:uncharacterized protein (TIGR02996 family)